MQVLKAKLLKPENTILFLLQEAGRQDQRERKAASFLRKGVQNYVKVTHYKLRKQPRVASRSLTHSVGRRRAACLSSGETPHTFNRGVPGVLGAG